METLAFTVAAVVLYIAADRLLDRIEIARGARLPHRNLIFFAILLGLALVTFWALRVILEPAPPAT